MYEDREWDFLSFEGSLVGVEDMSCLKSLQIPLPFLTGNFDLVDRGVVVDNVIPRNLEILVITDDGLIEWYWEEVWEDGAVSTAVGRWYGFLETCLVLSRMY